MTMTLSGSGTGTVGVPNSGTAQNSTSGTSIAYTGLPSGLKRITIMLNGVSTNGSSLLVVQIGSGSYTASGYQCNGKTNTSTAAATNGFPIDIISASSSFVRCGTMIITHLGSNIWTMMCNWGDSSNNNYSFSGGVSPALGGALDRLQVIATNGTDAFDAGSINILYE